MSATLKRWPILILGALAAASMAGCPSCAPQTVAEGVARLTVRNVGAMVSLVNANDQCGFASTAVLSAPTIDGAVGSEGTITYTVTDCEIDLGDETTVSEDCTDGTVTASGKVTLSATRRIAGILTGNPASPVVPGGPDAATITITAATFDNFLVVNSKSDNRLTMIAGSISGVAKPRLAVAASSGACAVATPNVTFSDIVYGPSTVRVQTADNDFEADVTVSAIAAQNGINGAEENSISGTMTVFDSPQDVTGDGVLDADYTAEDFTASYACTADLADPESFQCADLTPRLADGAARLSIKMLGTVASLLDADTSCGFSSEAALGAATLDGTPGGDGSLTIGVSGCELSFPTETLLDADCNGTQTRVMGTVTVTGTKVVSGRVTGNAENPIVPITDQPAVISLTVNFDDFMVGSTANENSLTGRGGMLMGTVSPVVYVGAETGVCSVSTPNAVIGDVEWMGGDLLLTTVSGSFALDVSASELSAANGNTTVGVNALSGTLTVDGTAYTIPGDGAGLDPEWTQATHDASWQCNDELADPLSHSCAAALSGKLGGGAASLTMRTLGTVTSLINANSSCGFASPAVGGDPGFAGGDVGDDDVTATFYLAPEGCTITLPADTVVATDCLGNTTAVGGTVVVRGTKSVTGFRTGDPYEPIVPTSFKPATFTLNIAFTDFVVESSASTSSLRVQSGDLSGVVQPRVGLDTTSGACSITTPNVSFSNVAWVNAQALVTSDGSTLPVLLQTSALAAQNGSDGTATNTLSGDIYADDVQLTGLSLPLDPEFDQAAFDSTYTCTPNLMMVPDAGCSFRTTLGYGAARLLVKAAGTATGMMDSNNTCGFADPTPTTAPVLTGTPTLDAPVNLTLTADAACATVLPVDVSLPINCVGTVTHVTGDFTVGGGTKSIDGIYTGNPASPVAPVTRDGATFTMSDIAFNAFTVYDQLVDTSIPNAVTLTGTVDVTVDPVAGRSDGASTQVGTNVYSVKTGVAAISNLTMASGTLTIESGTKTFNVTVTNADLDAFVGAWVSGGSNDLSGSLTVDGVPVTLPAGFALMDPYDQAAFNATYSCQTDLAGDLVPVN